MSDNFKDLVQVAATRTSQPKGETEVQGIEKELS